MTPRFFSILLVAATCSVAGCAASRPPQSAPANASASAIGDDLNAAQVEELARTLPVASAPHPADYRIGPEDVLEISVLEAPELDRSVRVSGDGDITLPPLGVVRVAGLTPRELEIELEAQLRNQYMVDPHVGVQIGDVQSHRVFIMGAVKKPGAFPIPLREKLTVLQAVSLGEGLQATAAKDRAVIIRTGQEGTRSRIAVNLGDILRGEAADIPLQPRDVVFVPNSMGQSFARGALNALLRMVTLRAVF